MDAYEVPHVFVSDQDGMERWLVNVKELIRTINHTLKSHNLFLKIVEFSSLLWWPDSMALLYLLQDIATHRHTTYKIGVAIVDHCISP